MFPFTETDLKRSVSVNFYRIKNNIIIPIDEVTIIAYSLRVTVLGFNFLLIIESTIKPINEIIKIYIAIGIVILSNPFFLKI